MNRIVFWLLMAGCAYFGWQKMQSGDKGPGFSGFSNVMQQTASAAMTEAELRQLAATVKRGEIVMYSQPSCGYCNEAKGWLTAYGFEYKDCDVTKSSACLAEYHAYQAKGTPLMVYEFVGKDNKRKTKVVSNSFDAAEMIELLRS